MHDAVPARKGTTQAWGRVPEGRSVPMPGLHRRAPGGGQGSCSYSERTPYIGIQVFPSITQTRPAGFASQFCCSPAASVPSLKNSRKQQLHGQATRMTGLRLSLTRA